MYTANSTSTKNCSVAVNEVTTIFIGVKVMPTTEHGPDHRGEARYSSQTVPYIGLSVRYTTTDKKPGGEVAPTHIQV